MKGGNELRGCLGRSILARECSKCPGLVVGPFLASLKERWSPCTAGVARVRRGLAHEVSVVDRVPSQGKVGASHPKSDRKQNMIRLTHRY